MITETYYFQMKSTSEFNMEEEDIGFTSKKRDAKKGRRAKATLPDHPEGQPNGDLPMKEIETTDAPEQFVQEQPGGPPLRPQRRQMGWGSDTPKSSANRDNAMSGVDAFEDERLRPDSSKNSESDDGDIPVIPDLDDVQEEDMAMKIAAPPTVQVNRVATYRELDNDLLKHSQLITLDNDIDLKLLTKSLSAESELKEDDIPWNWEHLFTEVASELQTEWDQEATGRETDGKTA